jgi:propanol-preferring alcohol dehydrogenase
MKSMLLREITQLPQNPTPLTFSEIPEPAPTAGEVLLRVTACGVCHTELDEIEGRTPPPRLPVVLGHQVVGIIEGVQTLRVPTLDLPQNVQHREMLDSRVQNGQRVGVAWIASACGECDFCTSGQENLCPQFKATGRDVDGGYAEYMKVRADFVHPISDSFSDLEAAPLLCAGAIGYRSLRLSNLHDGQSLGLMGFGGSNHLVLKLARHKFPNAKIFVFSRSPKEREFALSLGATWAGGIDQSPLGELDAVIDTTPVWGAVSEALKRVRPGGRVVINAIRKEESDKSILSQLDYPSQLWMEKEIKSVANVTRADVREFLQVAAEADIKPEFQEYELKDANVALLEIKQGKIHGSKVLRM